MENNKTPSIRFKGFTDPWEQRKLGDVAQYRNGKAHENCIDENGKYVVVNSKFVSTDGEVKKFSNMQNEALFENEIAFVLSDVPNGRAIARTYLIEKSDKYTLNQRIAGITPLNETYPYFLYILMNRHPYFLAFDDGAKQTNLSVSDVMGFETYYPKYSEQQKIGAYFRNLDNLITLHQRKYDKLQNIKKSMLEKMFPKNGSNVPEIRFSGFTDPWEQRKLGDTNIFFADGNYGEAYPKASDMTDSSTGIPFLTGGNLKNGRLDLSGANYITYEKHMKLTSGHLAEDDIVIAVRGSLGALGYVNKGNSGWNINSQLAILRTDKTVLIGKYLIQFLLSTTGQKELLSKQTGSALKQLPISSLKDIAIPVTSIEEQERIGMYLQNLDHLITLHQRELEKLQNIKKSMLEKMFV